LARHNVTDTRLACLQLPATQLDVSRAINLACCLARFSPRAACTIRQQMDSLQRFEEKALSWLGGGAQPGGGHDAFESQVCVAYIVAATSADPPTATAGASQP
jgi:hypothetical protein